MYVLPNVNLRQPVRILIANVGAEPVVPSFRVFRTNGREVRVQQYQQSPTPGPIPPNGTWLTTLTFLDVGAGSEPIDGQVQIACGDDASLAVQYEYDQLIRTTIRLNAVRKD
jgi:hypothetical protein